MLVKTAEQKAKLLTLLAEKEIVITQSGCALEPGEYVATIGDGVRCVLYDGNSKALLLQTATVNKVDCDFMINPKDINKYKKGKTLDIVVKAHEKGNRVSVKKQATEATSEAPENVAQNAGEVE